MLEPDVGGGFGVRGEFYPEDFLIPFAARLAGRPVKWIEDRREHLMATNHSREIECDIEIACTRDGVILGMRGHIYGDMGAYIRTNGGVVPAKAAQFLPGPYRIRDIAVTVDMLLTNKTPVGTMRAPGRFEANFFRERLFDMVARDLALDPMEFRRKNLITEARAAVLQRQARAVRGRDRVRHRRLSRRPSSARSTEIGWEEKKSLQGRLIDGRYHGLAAAPFIESGGSGKENCRAGGGAGRHASPSMSARRCWGRGSRPRSRRSPPTRSGCRSSASGFCTARPPICARASAPLRQGRWWWAARRSPTAATIFLRRCAPPRAKNSACPTRRSRSRTVSSAPAAKRAALAEFAGIKADGTFSTAIRTYSYGAHACHVAVDARTGAVEIVDYIAIEDVGRVINPHIVHGQAIGALAQGLGGVFLDEIIYDSDGQILNTSLAEYLVPTASDFPNLRAHHDGTAALQDQPARRQGRGRGRHGGGGGDDRQRRFGGARAARCRGPRPAAVAGAAVAADQRLSKRHRRHCERSEAIQSSSQQAWIASSP